MSLKKSINDRDKVYTKTTKNILKPFKTKLDKVAILLLQNKSKIQWTNILMDEIGTVAIYGVVNFKVGDTFYDINADETVVITKENLQDYGHAVNLTIPGKNLEKSTIEEIVEIIKENSKNESDIISTYADELLQ